MQSRNVVFPAGHALPADVGTPQVENLVQPTYQSEILSDRVATGRAKSALNSEQVPVIRKGTEAPLQRWSRGCRRAHVSFWCWLLLQLSPLVPRKKKWHPSRSPRKSWKPASTSKLPERACLLRQGGPAPNSGLLCPGAVEAVLSKSCTSIFRRPLWAGVPLSPIGPACCHDRGWDRC